VSRPRRAKLVEHFFHLVTHAATRQHDGRIVARRERSAAGSIEDRVPAASAAALRGRIRLTAVRITLACSQAAASALVSRSFDLTSGSSVSRAATIRAVGWSSRCRAYEMEEMLYELPYAPAHAPAGTQGVDLEFVMTDPAQVWPDRFGVESRPAVLATSPRLVAISLKRAPSVAAWPPRSQPGPEVNRARPSDPRRQQWEASRASSALGRAHFHMKTAGSVQEADRLGWSRPRRWRTGQLSGRDQSPKDPSPSRHAAQRRMLIE